VVGRQIVSLSARVVGRDAMTSKNTPSPAAGLGIWGNLGIWITFGAAFGVLVGLFLGNYALGVSIGPCLGVAAWAIFFAPRTNARRDS
jgi:hypothetical protein